MTSLEQVVREILYRIEPEDLVAFAQESRRPSADKLRIAAEYLQEMLLADRRDHRTGALYDALNWLRTKVGASDPARDIVPRFQAWIDGDNGEDSRE